MPSRQTQPGIVEHKRREVALASSGVEIDVVGVVYDLFNEALREADNGASSWRFVQE
jgi:hypothetical protein